MSSKIKEKEVCCVCGNSQHTNKYRDTGKFYCSRHYTQLQYYGKILDRTKYDPNEIIECESFAIVVLYGSKNIKNGECIIDLEDVEMIKEYKWALDKQGYVVTRSKDKKRLSMHRLLLKPTDNELVDHINLNKSDNRKSNLRIVNKSQNEMNKPVRSDNSCGIKGIYEDKSRNKWVAELCYNGKKVLRKRFDTLDEAVKARKDAEIKYFGEFRYQETTV